MPSFRFTFKDGYGNLDFKTWSAPNEGMAIVKANNYTKNHNIRNRGLNAIAKVSMKQV